MNDADSVGRPAVTVVLPAWNSAATLRVALESIRWQTLESWELLVMDDGSSDDTVAVARSIEDGRISVHADGRHAGLATRLNQAIDLARGRFLARMDADDLAYPERLRTQMAFLDSHPDVDLVASRALAFRGDGAVTGLLPYRADHAAICAKPWSGIPMPHPTWFGRIEWFRRFRYAVPDALRAEDQELLIRARFDSRYAACPEILLGYRQGTYSLSRMLKGRVGRLRAVSRHALAAGRPLELLAATSVTLGKAMMDVVLAVPGCESLFLQRTRALPTDRELQRWESLWRRLNPA